MKLFKSIAIRATALLLFFAMISAVILWQAGVYDISFIERPPVITTEGDQGGDTDIPPSTTKPFEGTLPSDDDEQMKEILNAIKTLDEVKLLGYELSYDIFSSDSVLAKIDMPYSDGVYSHRFQNVSKNVFYTKENGRPAIKVQSDIEALPRIQLYYGYALIDNDKTYDIYSPDGKELVKDFDGTLVYARSGSGYPVVKDGDKLYHIDPENGLVEITESEVKYKALAFDQPRYYGTSDIELYPFAAEVEILTYVGEVPTEPPATTPSDTTEGGTTGSDGTQATEGDTTEGGGTQTTEGDTTENLPSDTTAGETEGDTTTGENEETTAEKEETTTEATTTTIPETENTSETEGTLEVGGGAELQNNEVEGEASSSTTTSQNQTTPKETTTVPDGTTTAPGGTTTAPEGTTTATNGTTTVPDGTTAVPDGTTSTDGTTSPEETEKLEPVNGTIIKDGAYYKVSKAIRYGYKDKDGNVVIEPQFAEAFDFTPDGFAAVRDTKGNVYFINENGVEVVSIRGTYYAYPAEFNKRKLHQRFTDGINMTIEDLGMYYYDNGYCMIRYALLDPYTAKTLYKTQNVLINKVGSIIGMPGNYTLENYSDGVMLLSKNETYGYMSTDMSWVCPAIFSEAEPFVQGLAVAQLDGKYGMIDREGNTVLPFCFKYISNVSDGRIAAYSDELGWQLYAITAKAQAQPEVTETQGVTTK